MLTVREVMVPEVITISPYATLREALSLMRTHRVKSLVVDPQHSHDAYGLLSYNELLRAIVAEEGDVDLLNVYDVAVKPAVSVGEGLSVNQAAVLMGRLNLNRLVVVRGDELIGLLTVNGILARLIDDVT